MSDFMVTSLTCMHQPLVQWALGEGITRRASAGRAAGRMPGPRAERGRGAVTRWGQPAR